MLPKGTWPLAVEDRDIPPLLLSFLVPHGDSTATVGIVLDVQSHAIAAHDRTILGNVATCKVIVFLQIHLRIKLHGGVGLDHEEITQNEVSS